MSLGHHNAVPVSYRYQVQESFLSAMQIINCIISPWNNFKLSLIRNHVLHPDGKVVCAFPFPLGLWFKEPDITYQSPGAHDLAKVTTKCDSLAVVGKMTEEQGAVFIQSISAVYTNNAGGVYFRVHYN